jgi:hypothetical protein
MLNVNRMTLTLHSKKTVDGGSENASFGSEMGHLNLLLSLEALLIGRVAAGF